MRAFSVIITLLAMFVRIGFKGVHNGSNLSIAASMFDLPLLHAISCGFIICDPGYILGLYCILVHYGLLI